MANRMIFSSRSRIPVSDCSNSEGAPAYALSPAHALAQYATTGCLNNTFYADAGAQLSTVLQLCEGVAPEFVAKTAVYARTQGHMKDMPALLVAWLSVRAPALCSQVFDRVIDNGKMLRNFVQIVRSGAVGRKSLGSSPKRLVRRWFEQRSDVEVFRASVGQAPSLADVVKLAHPRPQTPSRSALYAYLLDRNFDVRALPEVVRTFEAYKQDRDEPLPSVPFQLLTAMPLRTRDWQRIAERASWHETRMNLNTFMRNGVFESERVTQIVAQRLADRGEIERTHVLPYQLMSAYFAASDAPKRVREALERAMEIALDNVPSLEGKVVVCPDVSGSMQTPVTGVRKGSTTSVRCVDVAALMASALARRNDAMILPFEQEVVNKALNISRRNSVMQNAAALAQVGGGGTNCSAPLAQLNSQRRQVDVVILVSDNESWVDARRPHTAMMAEWDALKVRNPNAKLLCVDLQPNRTTQAPDRADILNVGGFSDAVFEVAARFARGENAATFVQTIEEIVI